MGKRLWKGECIKGDVKALNRYGETIKDDGNDLNGDGERQEGVRGQRKMITVDTEALKSIKL